MVNRTEDTLTVFVDRCFWYTRMARIPPGKARQARLPGELIAYDGRLLFHAFTVSEHVGSFTTPIEPVPVVEVVLDDSLAVDRETLPSYVLDRGEARQAVERTVVTDLEHGYTAVWGVGGGGILTWACSRGDPYLSVATGSSLRREVASVEVRYRLDDGEWSEPEPWEVVRSLTDAVVAPRERVDELTRAILAAERVQFDVEERRRWRSPSFRFQFHFAFDVSGVAPELGGLPCVRDLLPRDEGTR